MEVVALLEHRPGQVSEAMLTVDQDRVLAKLAALSDLDRGRALDQDVIGEDRPRTDRYAGLGAPELRAKASSEFDSGTDHERAAVGHIEAEAGPEIGVTVESDPGVRIAKQDPPLA